MDIDLESLSREDLEKLRANIDKALKSLDSRRRAEARRAAEAKARELGFTLEELVASAPSGNKAKSVARYRHPENPDVTWTGRGRQPGWIKEGLAAGKSLEDFAI